MGMSPEAIADDHAKLYKDWGDVVMRSGVRIQGFLESTTDYPEEGESVVATHLKILHSPVSLSIGETVSINGIDYKVETRDEVEGEYSYRVNSS